MSGVGVRLWVYLLVAAGIIAAQIWLSRRQNGGWGWILPVVFLVLAVATAAGFTAAKLSPAGDPVWVVTSDGAVSYRFTDTASARECAEELEAKGQEVQVTTVNPAPSWGQVAAMFLVCNVPTAVCAGIHIVCRRTRQAARRRAVDKTRIDDLGG